MLQNPYMESSASPFYRQTSIWINPLPFFQENLDLPDWFFKNFNPPVNKRASHYGKCVVWWWHMEFKEEYVPQLTTKFGWSVKIKSVGAPWWSAPYIDWWWRTQNKLCFLCYVFVMLFDKILFVTFPLSVYVCELAVSIWKQKCWCGHDMF